MITNTLLAAELAFESLAGLPTEPKTALQFSRYAVDFLPTGEPGANLVMGISVSGEVSRTLPARVVDSTGAGDSFCGGFAVGLAGTGDPVRAAQYGTVSASMVIEGYRALYALHSNRNEAQARLHHLEQLTRDA